MSILEYLKEEHENINEIEEVDKLVFLKLTYIPFELIMSEEDTLSIKEVKDRLDKKEVSWNLKQDIDFLKLLSTSKRYSDLTITRVKSILDLEKEEQFMAITILLSNKTCYVAYRGTTDDLVAWMEDSKMVYDVIPAQKDALSYLNNVSNDIDTIYVGGHSKGGNLAMYASMYADKKILKKIKQVDNFDGPGFLILDDAYYNIRNKITSYIPSDSIVGRMFNLDNKTLVVKSFDRGISQHNLYNWHIKNNQFVLTTLSKESDLACNMIKEFFDQVDRKEWTNFIDTLYTFLRENNITSKRQITFNDLKQMLLSYKNMREDTKKKLYVVLSYIFKSMKENVLPSKKEVGIKDE